VSIEREALCWVLAKSLTLEGWLNKCSRYELFSPHPCIPVPANSYSIRGGHKLFIVKSTKLLSIPIMEPNFLTTEICDFSSYTPDCPEVIKSTSFATIRS